MTNQFIESGAYEIEIMGKKYPAQVFLRSPFDPEGQRLQGQYCWKWRKIIHDTTKINSNILKTQKLFYVHC